MIAPGFDRQNFLLGVLRLQIDAISLLMVAITAVMMAWAHWGMNRSVVYDMNNTTLAWVNSDALDGGDSQATLQQDYSFKMRCEINEPSVAEFPYCNLGIALSSDAQNGVDLTKFDSIHITMEHKSTSTDTPRLYLNHFYADPEEFRRPFKMNMSEISNVASGIRTYQINLNDLVVPFWWVCESQDSNALVNVTNVREMLVSTGAETHGRVVELGIHRVEFRGKWMSEETLYRVLLIAWMFWIVGMLIFRFYKLSSLSSSLRERSARLQKANIELGGKAAELKIAATTDELTGLLNRAGIKEVIDKGVQDHLAERGSFSVVLLDIDHFKKINDHYGHNVGDRVLRQIAQCLENRCRKSDFPSRWGGEEFLLVCVNTGENEAKNFAESLRQEIREFEFSHGQTVTCSVGVAHFTGDDVDAVIKKADIALYQAKRNGRDRVELYESSPK